MRKRNQIEYLTVAKAILIFAIVLGHCEAPVKNFVYLFHVAAFFFISGYFYKDEYSKRPFYFLKKKVQSIYVPFFVFSYIFLFLHNIFLNLNIYSELTGYKNSSTQYYATNDFINWIVKVPTFAIDEPMAGTFWFLVCLFTVNVMFCLLSFAIEKITNKHIEYYRFFVVSILLVMGFASIYFDISLKRNLEKSLILLTVFYLGYLYKRNEYKIPFSIYHMLLAFAILLVSMLFGKIDIVSNIYTNPLFFLVCSMAGVYFVFSVSKFISGIFPKWILIEYVGNSSLIIMILHFICFKAVNWLQIVIYNYPNYMMAKFPVLDGSHGWWIMYALVGTLAPICIKYVFDEGVQLSKKGRYLFFARPNRI